MMNSLRITLCFGFFSLSLFAWFSGQSLRAQNPIDAVVGSDTDQVVKPGDSEADVLKVLPPPSRIDRVAVRDGVVELWYFDKAGILIRMKKIGPHPGEVLSSSDLR